MGAGEAARIVPLMRQFYAHFGYPFSLRRQGAALGRLLADPSIGRAWLIDVGGEAAGYAVLVFGWSIEYAGRTALLDELFVAAPHRNGGLGTWALRQIRARACALGVRRLLLEVEADNRGGQALYKRLGYRDTKRRLMVRRV